MNYYRKQIRVVLTIELVIIAIFGLVAYSFWESFCGSNWRACLAENGAWSPMVFLVLSILRPMLFSPLMIMAMIGGYQFGSVLGTLLTALGAGFSALLLYYPGVYLGKRLVRNWLQSNFPATWRLIRTQDYKLVFIARWIPLFPFDLASLLFGVANFNAKRVFIWTVLGCLPEAWVFNKLGAMPQSAGGTAFLFDMLAFVVLSIVPLLAFEFLYRKRGSSLWNQLKKTYNEIVVEANVNNNINKRTQIDPGKTPIVLVYGFFSTRRSMVIFERVLTHRGFQVITFNLGGVLGVFFTKGVRETAEFIDEKIKRQLTRHNLSKVHIISHSKGGLVALWWLLKMGGSRYCDKIITMGTPFKGSWLTYLALMTPLGFFWRDVWQMRPGSEFLRELHQGQVPANLKIYCCYSDKDKVCHGADGLFKPIPTSDNIVPIPMHHVGHFEYLYRRDVIDSLTILLAERKENPSQGGSNPQESGEEKLAVNSDLPLRSDGAEKLALATSQPSGEAAS